MRRLRCGLGIAVAALVVSGCGPRVLVVTGTTLGVKATPGDGSSRPPQVTLGYKRAETAIVPTKGDHATAETDAYSVLAAFDFRSEWFGTTELASFIATGNAATDIQGKPGAPSAFATAFAAATVVPTPAAIQARRKALIDRWRTLDEAQASAVLTTIDSRPPDGWTATQWLQDVIAKADVTRLSALETALAPAEH